MSRWSVALNRFGLGRRPDEALPDDPARWLLSQFDRFEPAPPAIVAAGDSATVASEMSRLQAMRRETKQRENRARRDGDTPEAELGDMNRRIMRSLAQFRRTGRQRLLGDVKASIETAIASDTPFIERLVHFWSNHFAVSADKNRFVAALAGSFEFEAIRPHVLGRFSDMVAAVERHPAMLLFLDQAQSIGPDSPFLSRRGNRRRGLNENLAREILELHTMGVRSGYTQQDVVELAKALTGWTFAGQAAGPLRRLTRNAEPGRFVFVPELHEPGERVLLGRRYPEGGEAQAAAMLEDVSRSREAARFISTKLARHFAGDEPPPALVERLEAAFLQNDGDLPSLYRVLVDAPECWDEGATKVRSPWDWLVATLRATGQSEVSGRDVAGLLDQLGQPLWSPGSPAGYADTAETWLSADGLIRRVGIASQLTAAIEQEIDPRALGKDLFPGALDPATLGQVGGAQDRALGLAILLSSPQMLRR